MHRHNPTISELLRQRTWAAPVFPRDVIDAARTAGVGLVDGRVPKAQVATVDYEVERIARNRSFIDNKHYFHNLSDPRDATGFSLCWTCMAPSREACHYPMRDA